MRRSKPEIITFKADRELLRALEGMPNRSEFIRQALLAAVAGVCPMCKGSGILTPNQKAHWDVFARHHRIDKCNSCQERHLVCNDRPMRRVHR